MSQSRRRPLLMAAGGGFSPDDISGLINWWPFNGDVLDHKGSNDCTDFGTTSVSGLGGKQARQFTRSESDYLHAGQLAWVQTYTNSWTLSFWFQVDQVGISQGLDSLWDGTFSNGRFGFLIDILPNNAMQVIFNSSQVANLTLTSAAAAIAVNTPYNAIITWSGSARGGELFIDNVSQGSGTLSSAPTSASTQNFNIGRQMKPGINYLDGFKQEEALYNSVLNATDRAQLAGQY